MVNDILYWIDSGYVLLIFVFKIVTQVQLNEFLNLTYRFIADFLDDEKHLYKEARKGTPKNLKEVVKGEEPED